jgi:hypothetical protein
MYIKVRLLIPWVQEEMEKEKVGVSIFTPLHSAS